MTIPPWRLAAADQDLAATDQHLDEFINAWQEHAPHYGDRLHRIAGFMMRDLAPNTTAAGLIAMLAVAIERLAAR